MDEVVVKIRGFNKDQDQGMIYSTWRNSLYYNSEPRPKGSPENFFRAQTRRIKDILEKADVRIACLSDAIHTIIGYSVCSGTHLDWVYVKPDYRSQGIANLLLPKNIKTTQKGHNEIIDKLIIKKNLKIKGEEHGNSRNEDRQTDQRI